MVEKQDVSILPDESERTSGKSAQYMNILAATLVADAVRTTLGPKGMDKLLVDPQGNVIVTNDGVTILEQMRVAHPCAKMIVEIARTQEREIGDGTTSAVVLAGELLANAQALLEEGIHPTLIVRGYRSAGSLAKSTLERIALPLTIKQTQLIRNIAITAMTGKGVEQEREILAQLALDAVKVLGASAKRSNISVESMLAGSLEQSELLSGIVLDRKKLSPNMPDRVENAHILLLDTPVEIRGTEIDARVSISDPASLQAFLDREERVLLGMVERIAASGASVVISQRGIDDLAAHHLAKRGILAVRRVRSEDLRRLAQASGATIVANLQELQRTDLGAAGIVEQQGELLFVRECPEAKTITILVRGSTEHVIDEARRALEDAVGDVCVALSAGKVVAGAGAPEMEVAKAIDAAAQSLSTVEQRIVGAVARAFEAIPRTLAENAGLDPASTLKNLREAHASGGTWIGIDVMEGTTMDAWERGIVEPLAIKLRALSSALEVATMILRIDDVIACGPEEQMPQEFPR